MLSNLNSTRAFNEANLTGPGCFAYPDMLEVGVTNSQTPGLPTLTLIEARTHFAAWCIVSAPLVLGLDLRDRSAVESVWPIIANEGAIAINQAWAGDSGVLVEAASDSVTLEHCGWGDDSCEHAAWMVWRKRLGGRAIAMLLMNNRNTSATVRASPQKAGANCARSCHTREVFTGEEHTLSAGEPLELLLATHGSALLLVTEQ